VNKKRVSVERGMPARLALVFAIVHVAAAARVTVCASSGTARLAPAVLPSPLPIRRVRSQASNSPARRAAREGRHSSASNGLGSDARGANSSASDVCLHAVHQAARVQAPHRGEDAAAERSLQSQRLESIALLNTSPEAVRSFALRFAQHALKHTDILGAARVSDVDTTAVVLKLTVVDASQTKDVHSSVDQGRRMLHVRVPLPAAYESIPEANRALMQIFEQFVVSQEASPPERAGTEVPEWGV